MIGLKVMAEWKYPVMGNFLTGAKGQAMAYLCNVCYAGGIAPKYAVEFVDGKQDDLKYHPVETLKPF
jgi:hypothetical protein